MGSPSRERTRTAILALALALAVFLAVELWDFTLPTLGNARYQAVFLANGQTYFGRFIDRLGPYAKLESVYYIQQTRAGEDPDAPPESRLVRRGNEVHGPRDPMYIPRSSILFTEDLRPSSPIARFIDEDQRR